MNIQQLRYVVAIANSGTFREASWRNKIASRWSTWDRKERLKYLQNEQWHISDTVEGWNFTKAQELVKGFDVFPKSIRQSREEKAEFSIASQHYDFYRSW